MPRRKIRVSTARVFARQTATTKIFKLTSAAYIFILTSGRVHANIYNVATGLCCDWVWRSLVACLNGVQEAGGSNPLTQTMRKPLKTLCFQGLSVALYFLQYLAASAGCLPFPPSQTECRRARRRGVRSVILVPPALMAALMAAQYRKAAVVEARIPVPVSQFLNFFPT